ncbi:hypothetical protein [Campylobacter troglodytis]|uniref:hypothetical protein n=1 Tax=Campylobacter troglodytis TaxID=654363 RepID=UPI0011577424|nr:hypothetical protein [Campylobacter troglodytis]TQR60213.1 hypothetical protein DMC01_06855 [Campylobacter troglodytis]
MLFKEVKGLNGVLWKLQNKIQALSRQNTKFDILVASKQGASNIKTCHIKRVNELKFKRASWL